KGENIPEPGIPESFRVLLKEMQSLCLNVEVLSSDGTAQDVKESDEEVFRAAEELGIDLSRRPHEGVGSIEEVCRTGDRGGGAPRIGAAPAAPAPPPPPVPPDTSL